MKISYSLTLLVFSFFTTNLEAQVGLLDSFSYLGNSFDRQWKENALKIEGDALAGSSSFNVKMFNDILFRPTFSEDAKQEFVGNGLKSNNTIIQSNLGVEFKVNDKWGVYTKYASFNALKLDNDFSKLLLFGNANYENQQVTTENSKFLSATTTSVGITNRTLSTNKWQIKTTLGLQLLSSYREISANKFGVFTGLNGQYLDIEAKNVSISETSNGIQGVGLTGGLKTTYVINDNSSIAVDLSDFGATNLINKTKLELDTSFTFTGIFIDVFQDSSDFVDQLDSTYGTVVTRGRKDVNWVMLPSNLSIKYQRRLSEKMVGTAHISTVGFGVYGVSGNLGIHYSFGPNLVLYSAVGYGNFTGIQWREAVEYRRGKSSFYISATGLQFVAISKLTKNYGLSLGYAFNI